jgi:hypothetical protein
MIPGTLAKYDSPGSRFNTPVVNILWNMVASKRFSLSDHAWKMYFFAEWFIVPAVYTVRNRVASSGSIITDSTYTDKKTFITSKNSMFVLGFKHPLNHSGVAMQAARGSGSWMHKVQF